jgi:hypothetical protein
LLNGFAGLSEQNFCTRKVKISIGYEIAIDDT